MSTLDLLDAFVRQRPGLDPRGYISHARDTDGQRAYRADCYRVRQQLHDARVLLSLSRALGITDSNLADAMRSGRLTLESGRLSYCAGQYYPTEYRGAVCRVLASALFNTVAYTLPAATGSAVFRFGEIRPVAKYPNPKAAESAIGAVSYPRETHYWVTLHDSLTPGGWIRHKLKTLLPLGVWRRWVS